MQPVAKSGANDATSRATDRSANNDDPMGFAGLGEAVPLGEETIYVRRRLPSGSDPVTALSLEVERGLKPLLGKNGDKRPFVGDFARAGLDHLEAAKKLLATLPSEHKEVGARIFVSAWRGAQNETAAMLRDSGLPNAKRGKSAFAASAKGLARAAKQKAEDRDPDDLRRFHKIHIKIRLLSENRERASVRAAVREVVTEELHACGKKIPNSEKDKQIEILRKRYHRYKKKYGTLP